jgi:hypothetical protein
MAKSEGTVIQIRDMTITIKAADADKVYEIVRQLIGWGTECQEEAKRLRDLVHAADRIHYEAVSANWIDAAGPTLIDDLDELRQAWDERASELEAALRAYDDSVSFIASILDQQP